MVKRNLAIAHLPKNYLFVEIEQRKQAFLKKYPDAKLINLGIGDTTEPLPACITQAMHEKVTALGTYEGYTGYGSAFGEFPLREAIAQKIYHNEILGDEVFVSDGAKCDLGRLQFLFSQGEEITVQEPAYPAYMAAALCAGKKGRYSENLGKVTYLCSPNNPTGECFSKEQLTHFVEKAHLEKSLLIFDSAYAAFIRDPAIPKSIYEIPGAEKVAIETGSFSKSIGFTGVRLGWTVVPKALYFDDGTSIREDWMRVLSTFFNGPSSIAQVGGLAALSNEGLKASYQLVELYLNNARALKSALEEMGYVCVGGDNSPYIWAHVKGKTSWEVFGELLHRANILTTPGIGFGPSFDGYIRFSAFNHPKNIDLAIQRLLSHTLSSPK